MTAKVKLKEIRRIDMLHMNQGQFTTSPHKWDTLQHVSQLDRLRGQTETEAHWTAANENDPELMIVVRDYIGEPIAAYHMGEKIA